jgi:hypothetical protein
MEMGIYGVIHLFAIVDVRGFRLLENQASVRLMKKK